jgi:hypothetical protein
LLFKVLINYTLTRAFLHLKEKIEGRRGAGAKRLRGGDKIKVLTSVGTLGYFARCENSLGIISNAHVLRDEGCEVLRLPEGGTEILIAKVEKVMIVNNLLGFL